MKLLSAKQHDLINGMPSVIEHLSFHDLHAMLPVNACRSLLWNHVVYRNLWDEFENALRQIGMHESVWQAFFA